MNLIGSSINYKTAPIELRESLFLGTDEIKSLIPKLKEDLFTEGFILSTCNRTEIFGIPIKEDLKSAEIIDYIIKSKPVEGIEQKHFQKYFSCSAVRHMFNVASGIESLIIGDSQILGQTKEAFQISVDLDFSGSILTRFFDSTLKVGKRAISETAIGDGAVSVSYAAVQVVEKIFSNLNKKSALLIGAGETGELAAVHLKEKDIGSIAICNRTRARAEELAEKVNGSVLDFENLIGAIHKYDVIVSATSSDSFILSFDEIADMMKKRKGTPVCLMDIAIPRDIDPKVRKIENVFYHDIDSLEIIVEQNKTQRAKEIPAVEKIVLEELVNFFTWYNSLDIIPTIKSFRNFFEEIRKDELQKIRHKIHSDDVAKFDEVTKRLVGRILHNPTIKLRQIAESGSGEQELKKHTFVLNDLFNLGKKPNGDNE